MSGVSLSLSLLFLGQPLRTQLLIVVFVFVVMIGIPAVLFGVVLGLVRRRTEPIDTLELEDETDELEATTDSVRESAANERQHK